MWRTTRAKAKKQTHPLAGMCLRGTSSDRGFAFCDARFCAGFGNRRPPSFCCSLWDPASFPELADTFFRLLTRKSPPRDDTHLPSLVSPKRKGADLAMFVSAARASCSPVRLCYAFNCAKARSTAAIVSRISSSVCAVVMNHASYLDGARQMPSSKRRRKKRANSSPSAFCASS